MTIYKYSKDSIAAVRTSTFAELGITERGDLQRILRDHIEIIAPNCLVLTEEFGDWDDSKRRIDLLAIDKQANLVVIELKRDDAAHMELQAVRYAAMISTITFDLSNQWGIKETPHMFKLFQEHFLPSDITYARRES